MQIVTEASRAMLRFFAGQPGRSQHTLKVHALARLIAEGEGLDPEERCTLELAALCHDAGVRLAEERYGRRDGKAQEREGAEAARLLLGGLCGGERLERICYLCAHHHTYGDIRGLDYQILVEADFLVNLYEKREERAAVEAAYHTIFRTRTGRTLCKEMFCIEEQEECKD